MSTTATSTAQNTTKLTQEEILQAIEAKSTSHTTSTKVNEDTWTKNWAQTTDTLEFSEPVDEYQEMRKWYVSCECGGSTGSSIHHIQNNFDISRFNLPKIEGNGFVIDGIAIKRGTSEVQKQTTRTQRCQDSIDHADTYKFVSPVASSTVEDEVFIQLEVSTERDGEHDSCTVSLDPDNSSLEIGFEYSCSSGGLINMNALRETLYSYLAQ